jgi:endonuclease YncB( thermonuclease family)
MAIQIRQEPTRSIQHTMFPSGYFSGADVSIYFGDVLVDEVAMIQFSLQEPILPLKGYAAYTFDRVARGARVIQGNLAINFRRAGYLYAIMDHIGKLAETKPQAIPYIARILGGQPVEDIPEWVARAEETIEKVLKRNLGSGEETLAEVEAQIWKSGARGNTDVRYNSHFNSGPYTRNLQDRGFDIYMTYGPLPSHLANGLPERMRAPGTVKALYGVQLTGVQQTIAPDGRTIMEMYSFQARDLDLNSDDTPDDQATDKPYISKPLALNSVAQTPPIPLSAQLMIITNVVDGDTFHGTINGVFTKIRVLGIDTPETWKFEGNDPSQPYGDEATKKAKELLSGGSVYVLPGENPVDGDRVLAYVWLLDKRLFAEEMLLQGLGKWSSQFTDNNRYRDVFERAQRHAQLAQRKLWSGK